MAIRSGDQRSARLRSRATPGTLRLFSCVAAPREAQRAKRGGARRDRTDDLMLAKHALSQLSYGPVPEDECFLSRSLRARLRRRSGAAAFVQEACRAEAAEQRRLVGLGRLELPTSRLSSARSNQLSYKPLTLFQKGSGHARAQPVRAGWSAQAQPLARVRPRRKRNEDGEIPPMELNDLAIDGP